MPQMSPLLWNSLYILFSTLILMSMIKIYFLTEKKMLNKTQQNKKTQLSSMNWSW